jgi:hypothetical protein
MKKKEALMKRTFITLAVIFSLIMIPLRSRADVLTTAALGTSMGILAGATAMALTGSPGDHTSYPGIGAGIGLACGLALGLSGTDSKSFTMNYYQNKSYRHEIYGIIFNLPLY